jgi:hypothetical protein
MRIMHNRLWLPCFVVWYLVNTPASLVLIGMLLFVVLDREVWAMRKREAARQQLMKTGGSDITVQKGIRV